MRQSEGDPLGRDPSHSDRINFTFAAVRPTEPKRIGESLISSARLRRGRCRLPAAVLVAAEHEHSELTAAPHSAGQLAKQCSSVSVGCNPRIVKRATLRCPDDVAPPTHSPEGCTHAKCRHPCRTIHRAHVRRFAASGFNWLPGKRAVRFRMHAACGGTKAWAFMHRCAGELMLFETDLPWTCLARDLPEPHRLQVRVPSPVLLRL
jgi:hypothetical protein